jgi:heme exporter protein C
MRKSAVYFLSVAAALLFLRNLHEIFMVLPDEASQGMRYRIMYFHIPAWWTALLATCAAFAASVMYLLTRRMLFDELALAITEVAVAFLAIGLVTGSLWARMIWGIWWTWDVRLTSAFLCELLYVSYLVLRDAVDEPVQRAKLAAVYSLFVFADVPVVWFSIRLWRGQHPGPMEMPSAMSSPLFWNWLAMMLFAIVLVLVRFRQERWLRAVYTLRRQIAID